MHYRDPASSPPIELKIENIAVYASNLTNRDELKEEMFAKLTASAQMFGSQSATLEMEFDPLAKLPTFNLESAIRDVKLTHLNDFLMAYGKFNVDRGRFSLFSETAAKNGKFVAYVKPIFYSIDVVALESKQHHNNKLLVL